MATGRENLVLAGRIHGLSAAGRAATGPTSCSTGSASPTPPTGWCETYSGGMQRKLDVAIGLVHRPEVLFLDEPTTGLDPEARAEMWAEIARLAGDEGLTVLLTTHYLDEADRLADRLAIVDHGRVVVEGTPGASSRASCAATRVRGRGRRRADALARGDAVARSTGLTTSRVDGRDACAPGPTAAPARPGRARRAGRAGVDRGRRATVARPSLDDVYLRHAGRRFDGGGPTR